MHLGFGVVRTRAMNASATRSPTLARQSTKTYTNHAPGREAILSAAGAAKAEVARAAAARIAARVRMLTKRQIPKRQIGKYNKLTADPSRSAL